MSDEPGFDFVLTESDIEDLFGQMYDATREPVPSDVDVDAGEELAAVARRVSHQYVEIVAVISAQVLAGAGHAGSLDQLEGALIALRRLAEVHDDVASTALIGELLDAIGVWRVSGTGKRGRTRFCNTLRGWLPRYGRALDLQGGAVLREITEYDPGAVPLFAELESIRGVGPRRLQRLYCAGLFTVEALCGADPAEVSLVTGLPRELTALVVERTRAFAAEHRRRTVAAMRQRLDEFARILAQIDPQREPELASLARNAVVEMKRLVHDGFDGGMS